MSTATLPQPDTQCRTVADLVSKLGDIPLDRIRMHPLPGTATVVDLVENNDVRRDVRCELIDGILVEKAAMSYLENRLTSVLAYFHERYPEEHGGGAGFTEGAIYKMIDANFRLPDYTIGLKDNFPSGKVQRVPYADFAPDLTIEILSKSNTKKEIERKRQELFASGQRRSGWSTPASERSTCVTMWRIQ